MNIWHDISKERISSTDFIATIEISKGSKEKIRIRQRNGIDYFGPYSLHFDPLSGELWIYPENARR